LTFDIMNPSGAPGNVILDRVLLKTKRRSSVINSLYALRVTWHRTIPAPSTGGGILSLVATIGPGESSVFALLRGSQNSDLNFDLRPSEHVSVRVELNLLEPGMYSLSPFLFGRDAGGKQFQPAVPELDFGWTTTSAQGFASTDVLRSFSFNCSQ
jgi:hypothetical protein